jgi:GntR family transcriptional regulator, sialic acid-inducible nan operon repressor
MVESLVIARKKLFEHVAAHLEQQILSGRLRPGDQLPPERDLQATFGLVELTNGARARIMMPTASQILTGMAPAVRQLLSTDDGQRHFQRTRLFFEVGLAREAARIASDRDIAALQTALENNRQSIGDKERFVRTDIAFHFELARMAHNPVFDALHDQMSDWLKDQRVVTLVLPGQEETAYLAHRAISDAIASHDADAAEAAMRAHLEQLFSTYWHQRQAVAP